MKYCLRCGKSFERNFNYKRHLKRTKKCKVKILDVSYEEMKLNYKDLLEIAKKIDIFDLILNKDVAEKCSHDVADSSHKDKKKESKVDDKKFKCKFCNKDFKHSSSLYRHQSKRCKKRFEICPSDTEIPSIGGSSKTTSPTTTIHTQNNNYTQNNYTQNIIINNYGTEDTSYLTNKVLEKLIHLPFSSIQRTNNMIHFNKKHPENMNIKIKDADTPYVEIYKKDKWCIAEKKAIIKQLIEKAMTLVDEYYEETGKDKLPTSKNINYMRFQEAYNKDDKFQKRLEKEIEMMIVNGGMVVP